MTKIKQIEEKDHLDQQTKLNMCVGKIFANNYIPEYTPGDLPWYERDGLMTNIDQLKYKGFIFATDATIKNAKIINFKMIHAQWDGPRKHSD